MDSEDFKHEAQTQLKTRRGLVLPVWAWIVICLLLWSAGRLHWPA